MSILLKPTATFATTLSLEPASITLLLMMSVNTQTRASLSLTRCRRASADNELSEFKSTGPISWSLAITDDGRLRVTRIFAIGLVGGSATSPDERQKSTA